MGLALFNYESGNTCFPPSGESTNFGLTPATTQFVDGGWDCLARILPYMEGNTSFNALNFNVDYNEATGMNFTGCSTVVAIYLCPSSATRKPSGGNDGIDPNDPITTTFGKGYAYDDYGPTCYTDIDPYGLIGAGAVCGDPNAGTYYATPYRNKCSRADGLLKQGKTTIAQITDGTSNTICIGEDAGRDPRYLSPYTEGYYDGVNPRVIGTPSAPGYSPVWVRRGVLLRHVAIGVGPNPIPRSGFLASPITTTNPPMSNCPGKRSQALSIPRVTTPGQRPTVLLPSRRRQLPVW